MNTGVYMPSGNEYPGVFLRGEDALKFAGAVEAILSGTVDDYERAGFMPLKCAAELIRVLKSCKVTEGV